MTLISISCVIGMCKLKTTNQQVAVNIPVIARSDKTVKQLVAVSTKSLKFRSNLTVISPRESLHVFAFLYTPRRD